MWRKPIEGQRPLEWYRERHYVNERHPLHAAELCGVVVRRMINFSAMSDRPDLLVSNYRSYIHHQLHTVEFTEVDRVYLADLLYFEPLRQRYIGDGRILLPLPAYCNLNKKELKQLDGVLPHDLELAIHRLHATYSHAQRMRYIKHQRADALRWVLARDQGELEPMYPDIDFSAVWASLGAA
ncbi:MAG: hypothetical protein AAFR22_23035 [Chloroflexota bacterium]